MHWTYFINHAKIQKKASTSMRIPILINYKLHYKYKKSQNLFWCFAICNKCSIFAENFSVFVFFAKQFRESDCL